MANFTDGELLAKMVEEMDGTAINPTTENEYYDNGTYTDYNMDVTKLKGLLDVLKK